METGQVKKGQINVQTENIFPIIKKFFGFQAAALREVDTDNGSFVIELLTDLSENFGPASRHVFHGRFAVSEETCLTVLEIS